MTEQWQVAGDKGIQHYGREGWRVLLTNLEGHRYDLFLTAALLREQNVIEPGEDSVRAYVLKCLRSEGLGGELEKHRQDDEALSKLVWDPDGIKRDDEDSTTPHALGTA